MSPYNFYGFLVCVSHLTNYGVLLKCLECWLLGDIRLLESVQQRWTREIANVSHLAYVERLKAVEMFSIFGRLLRADLIDKCFKIFHSEVDNGLLDGFTVAVDQRTRGHSFKVVMPKCELDMRKLFM